MAEALVTEFVFKLGALISIRDFKKPYNGR